MMNILDLKIVKQSNGKFALWNTEDETFDYRNWETAEELKEHILDKADIILTESIRYFGQDDDKFKRCVEEYKIKIWPWH